MGKAIKIFVGDIVAEATLNDSKTAQMVYNALPITGEANLWDDEIYFDIDFTAQEENGKLTVELGDIALWLEGPCLCIFPGKTPVSRGNEIRPASVVNVIGKINNIATLYRKLKGGEKITFRR
ncbi:MAG: cyclophilin-like fold protein [Dehalococcoidales bacterium]